MMYHKFEILVLPEIKHKHVWCKEMHCKLNRNQRVCTFMIYEIFI